MGYGPTLNMKSVLILMNLTLQKPENRFVDDSDFLPDQICHHPFLKDPYEEKHVVVKKSSIPDAGEGLFATKNIGKSIF